jgi:hypothetical protein
VNPLESARTVPRLVFALFSIAVAADDGWLAELGLDEEVGDAPLPEPPDELLPHAASRTAKIANAAGSHLR